MRKTLTQLPGDVRIDLEAIDAVAPVTAPGEEVAGCRVLMHGEWVYLTLDVRDLYAIMDR